MDDKLLENVYFKPYFPQKPQNCITNAQCPMPNKNMYIFVLYITYSKPYGHSKNVHVATVCRVTEQVPEAISAIILKLLAKTAEERYQSAWGLKADLEECVLQLQTTGKIENFVPGRRDKSGQFSIGQRLYGREAEVTRLMEAFERVAGGSSELMLVSGYSGIGKTSVVNEVHKPIVGTRGYFIAGKFDQFKRNIPYASLIEAFQSLIQQLLTQSVAQIQGWKQYCSVKKIVAGDKHLCAGEEKTA